MMFGTPLDPTLAELALEHLYPGIGVQDYRKIIALNVEVPIFPRLLTHLHQQPCLPGDLEPEIEVVADGSPVDLDDAVAGFQLELFTQACGNDFGDFHAPSTNI